MHHQWFVVCIVVNHNFVANNTYNQVGKGKLLVIQRTDYNAGKDALFGVIGEVAVSVEALFGVSRLNLFERFFQVIHCITSGVL